MANLKYDAVFCDLGNVLVNFDHRIAVRKILCCTSKREEDIYQLFFDSGLTKLYEEGKIGSMDFFHRVNDSLGLEMDYETFLPIWNDIFFEIPLNKKMQNFIRNIKPDYKLIMISNINDAHFEFLREKMPIFREFDKLILSYEVGFRKPAQEIYDAGLKAAGISSSRVLYIDDRPDLIEKAGMFGIKGIAFNCEEAFDNIIKELE